MTCRAIISASKYVAIASFAVSFCVSSALASDESINWDKFKNDNWRIENESTGQGQVYSTYPLWLQTLYTQVFSWEPRVKVDFATEANCRLIFSSQLLSKKVSDLSQFIKEKPECTYLPSAENKSTLRRIINALSIHFDMSDTKHFRKILFKIPNGGTTTEIVVRGLVGIHDDRKARPLVIFRMGVHGNIDEFLAERFLAKLIYEDFGFNFLVLENLTSHGYLAKDNPITFGGVEEGLHTFHILQQLEASKLKNLISEIHLLGVSLGAHGVFLTEAIDEVNGHYLKSATVFCPVINLVETLMNQKNAKIDFGIIDLWNYRRLQAVRQRLPNLDPNDWWKTFFDSKPRYVPGILNYLETNQIRPKVQMPAGIKWPQGLENHLLNAKSFSDLNNFWNFYENKKTPMLIVTTPNDLLVSGELNTDLILQNKQPGQFRDTHILQLDRGIHCGLGSDYQWNFIIDLLKSQWGEPLD